MTESTMELMREDMAMGLLEPRMAQVAATRALGLAYGLAMIEPERAWLLTQFAADMLRASLPKQGSAAC